MTVVTHELSHAVGLGHSSDSNSVMYPYLTTQETHRALTTADLTIIEHIRDGHPEALMEGGFTTTTGPSRLNPKSNLRGLNESRNTVLPNSGISRSLGSTKDTEQVIYAERKDSVSGVLRTQRLSKSTSADLSAAVSEQKFLNSMADDYQSAEIDGLFADWAMDPLDLLMVSSVG